MESRSPTRRCRDPGRSQLPAVGGDDRSAARTSGLGSGWAKAPLATTTAPGRGRSDMRLERERAAGGTSGAACAAPRGTLPTLVLSRSVESMARAILSPHGPPAKRYLFVSSFYTCPGVRQTLTEGGSDSQHGAVPRCGGSAPLWYPARPRRLEPTRERPGRSTRPVAANGSKRPERRTPMPDPALPEAYARSPGDRRIGRCAVARVSAPRRLCYNPPYLTLHLP